MQLEMKRIILFVRDMDAMAAFYQNQLGLAVRDKPHEPGWLELDTGACTLALHSGGEPNEARRSPKIVFASTDVAATRNELVKQGARVAPIRTFGGFEFCEGKDPEGNLFQVSNRT